MSKPMALEPSIITPTPERMQHDRVFLYEKQIADSDGNIGSPFSVCSTVPLLFERKAISKAQVQAAFTYMDDFDVGRLHPLCAAPLEIRGKGKEDFSNAVIRARGRIWKARQALDMGTAVERAAWAVLGMRWNLSEWMEREGHPFSEQTAKRVFVTSLKELAKHYGFEGTSRK